MFACICAMLLKNLAILLVVLPCVAESKHSPPRDMVLYAHESRVFPTNTITVSAAPSGNKTGRDEFGLLRTVSNVLREGHANDSTVVGSQVGILAVGKDDANIYISFTYFFNANATYKGTLAVHGHIDGTSTTDRVFAVVGGTGDFLYATGIDRSAFDSRFPPNPADVVNQHYLTLNYRHGFRN